MATMILNKLCHLFLSGSLIFTLGSAATISQASAASGFEYLQTLAGDWIAVEGDANQTLALLLIAQPYWKHCFRVRRVK